MRFEVEVEVEVEVEWRSWPLGSPAKSMSAVRSRSRTAKLNDDLGSWREVFGSPAMGSLFFLSLSLSLRAGAISLAHTLSLSVFRKMVFEGKIKTEINLHHKHVRTEKHFRKMHFPCASKHPHLRKSISGNHFQPIQTEPKYGT